MTNDPLYQHLLELSWRRQLTSAQETQLRAWLAGHPETHADWEAETALNEALARLPDAPVPSNFTSLVLQSLERETAQSSCSALPAGAWLWTSRWLARGAFAAVVLAAGLFSYRQVRIDHRHALVKSVEAVSEVSSLPSPKILEDFDAIRALDTAPAADEQLISGPLELALLK